MSRRKQAKPKAFKPDLEPRTTILTMLPDDPALLDDQEDVMGAAGASLEDAHLKNSGYNDAAHAVSIQEKHEINEDSSESDALGTDEGSSWRSETPDDPTQSPAPSSCATPNSSTELPESELSYTVGTTEATPYACPFCEKAFPRLSYLKKHEQQNHSEHMPFKCEFCTRLFKHKRSRDRHIKLHTGDRKYRCNLCDSAFSRSDHLKIHLKTHDTQKPFQCTTCNRGYNTAAALTSHMQTHKRQAETPSTVVSAVAAVNNGSNNGRSSIEENAASHSPSYDFRCLQCGEIFQSHDSFEQHMLTGHRKPEDSNNMVVSLPEQLLPTLTTNLTCMYCTKDNFTTMEQLQFHVQAMHSSIINGNYSLEPQQQQQQGRPVLSKPPPLIPVLVGQPQPYRCDLCMMRFNTANRLQKHYFTTHRNASNNSSSTTTTTSTTTTAVSTEQLSFQMNYPFLCSVCGFHFSTPKDLAQHFQKHHRPVADGSEMKATDLSRKTPRSNSEERQSNNNNNKRLCIEDAPSREETPNNTLATTAQYNYPGILLCNQCEAAFPNFESFRDHQNIHLAQQEGGIANFMQQNQNLLAVIQQESVQLLSNPCICRICNREFQDVPSCEQHIFSHFVATATEYGCQSCRKTFPKPDELQKHLMDIHALHLYRCSLCKEVFDSKVQIQVHFAVKHSNECKLFRCTACPNAATIFHSEIEFGMHIRNVHNVHSMIATAFRPQTRQVQCTYCSQSFATDLELQFHLATHTKQFRCPVCTEVFHVEYLLDKHIQTFHNTQQNLNGDGENSHDGDKSSKKSSSNSPIVVKTQTPPAVVVVRTSSSASSQQKLENNNTTATKNDQTATNNNCNICERNDFSNDAELVAHRKLVHHIRNNSKNGAVSLHCAYCNEICKTRTELENHMKSHSQSSGVSGKHKCNICDELCPSPILLAEHKLTHCKVISGNCCTQCKLTISNEEQFYSHLVQHSNNNNGSSGGTKVKSQIALPSPCVICRQTLISDIEVRIHSQFHLRNNTLQRDIPCTICFKMVAIQNVHSSNGNYLCADCYSLQLSQTHHPPQTQHNTTTYTCIKCEASFDNERDVKIHVTNHFIEESGDTNECHLCRRLFTTPIKLQIHLIEHNFAGSSAFTCYLCSAVFTGAQGLLTHMIAEHGLGARPYDCSQCKQKFFFRSEVDNHSYTHLSGAVAQAAAAAAAAAARLTEADIALMSPKAYYISSNGDNNSGANLKTGDTLKKKKKLSINNSKKDDNVTVKEEPDYDEMNIEVVSPPPPSSLKTELNEADAADDAACEDDDAVCEDIKNETEN